jgi:RNA polymerase sigma-70 factor (ECF subfamily)
MSHSQHPRNPRDQQFADLSRQQDPKAFTLLWEYRPRLVLSVRRKFSAYIPLEDCEDLVTTTLIQAYEDGATFDPTKATLATWLNVRAHYAALEFLRRHNCELPLIEALAEFPAREQVLAEHDAREAPSEEIQHALRQLPRVWARAIQLFYYDGCSIPLIAAEMRVAESTVRCYLTRGLAQLRVILRTPTIEIESESDE